nr:GGDEF domain-containing protein [Marinobacter caseinilyticus]
MKERESAEVRERDRETQTHVLERLVVRTSLAAEGQEPELDRTLAQLRDQLRKDNADLNPLRQIQDAIDRQLIALDDRKITTNRQLGATLGELVAALRSHTLFAAETKALKQLGQALKRPETLRENLLGWLAEITALETRVLSGATDQRPSTGLRERLFGRKPEASALVATGAHEGAEPKAMTAPPLALAPEPAVAAEETDHSLRFAGRVAELLEQFLQRVKLAPAAQARAEEIRRRLAQSGNWDELRYSMSELADLMVAAVSYGQQEFESFLTRLDERLAALHSHFSAQADVSANRRTASDLLERKLSDDLRALGDDVRGSTDVEHLKQSVGRHIDSISSSLAQYRDSDADREVQLRLQLEAIKAKLAAAEAQSEHMQQKLREERKRALTDVLTQLPNREAWGERLEFEYTRWQRYGHPTTLCVLDIDHFKRVNDAFGHKAGDRVIQWVAKTLQERLRNTDFAARYGGEEFVVLLPETEPDVACQVIEGLRLYVSELPFHFQGEPVQVTFSAGLSAFTPGPDATIIFDQADKALYRAKAAGRNQWVLARDDAPDQ